MLENIFDTFLQSKAHLTSEKKVHSVLKMPRARIVIISKNTSVNLEMEKSEGLQNEDFIAILIFEIWIRQNRNNIVRNNKTKII